MSNRLLLLAVGILTSNALTLAAPDRKPHSPESSVEPVKGIRWRTNYNTARKEAEEKRKPLVLMFFKKQSPPSQRLQTDMERNEALCAYLNSATIPLKIDFSEGAELAAQLGIVALPTTVLAGDDGRILEIVVGYVEPVKLRAKLRATLGNQ